MKMIFRMIAALMAIAITTACQHDELLQTENQQHLVTGKVFSVKAYTPSEQPATRLAFEDKGTEGMKVSWSKDDAFKVFVENEWVTFTYNTDTEEFDASSTDGVDLPDGAEAFYPADGGGISQQTGALNSATTEMKGVYDAATGSFQFSHLTAILKAAFTGLPEATVSSISIDMEDEETISIAPADASINKGAVYINLHPVEKGKTLTFIVETSDNRTYKAEQTVKAEEGIQAGTFYESTIALREVCILPNGIGFKSAISGAIGNATNIVFEANSTLTGGIQIGTSGAYALVDGTTMKIYTATSEFIFNADCFQMFNGLDKITSIDFGDNINTANVTSMNKMFLGCKALTSLDLSNFNTANVTDMNNMFSGCKELTSLDLSNFNTANVTDMSTMFFGCIALTSLDLSSFNTANVTNMRTMFYDCRKLTLLDLSSFDFSKVTDFENMFSSLGLLAADRPIPVYVTKAGHDVLNSKTTGISSTYAQYVVPNL